jgi:hypothetical protein
MTHIPSVPGILVVGLLTVASLASAQNIVHSPSGPVPNPAVLDHTGLFQDKYATVGDG